MKPESGSGEKSCWNCDSVKAVGRTVLNRCSTTSVRKLQSFLDLVWDTRRSTGPWQRVDVTINYIRKYIINQVKKNVFEYRNHNVLYNIFRNY